MTTYADIVTRAQVAQTGDEEVLLDAAELLWPDLTDEDAARRWQLFESFFWAGDPNAVLPADQPRYFSAASALVPDGYLPVVTAGDGALTATLTGAGGTFTGTGSQAYFALLAGAFAAYAAGAAS